ncbi:hypothetical protein DYB26_013677, partial [Aphanomyces astaci]
MSTWHCKVMIIHGRHAQFLRADDSAADLPATSHPSDDLLQDLDSLTAKVRAIVKSQFAVIHRVFPGAVAPSVREVLIERVCHDPAFGLLSHLERLLGGNGMSDKEYVATLSVAYEKCCGLVQSIGSFPLDTPAESDRMRTFLTVQLQVLFGGHRQRYVQIEQDLLGQGFDKTLSMIKWPPIPSGKNKYKLKEQAAKETAKGHQITSPTSGNIPSNTTSLTSPASTTALASPRDAAPANKPEPLNLFYQMLLPISMDDTMPRKFGRDLQESTARCDVVLRNSELRVELMARLYTSYCHAFGDEYLGKMANLSHELVQEPLLCLESASNFFVVLKYFMLTLVTTIFAFVIYQLEMGTECFVGEPCVVGGKVLTKMPEATKHMKFHKRILIDSKGNLTQFEDVFSGIWFIIVTITSVGYGDIVPINMSGKFIAVLAMIFGACYTAMPLTLVGSQFNRSFNDYKRREALTKTKQDVSTRLALAADDDRAWK